MGSAKGQREQQAQQIAGQAAQKEQGLADQMQTELQQRKTFMGANLPESLQGAYDTAQNFAMTGGFAPGEQEAFLRRSTAPVAAAFSRGQDILNRQRALQGGYMPGYGASMSRLTRQGAQAGAEAGLNANVALAEQVRQGRQFGQTALQRYATSGLSALNDADITQLRNRLQAGQLTMDDAQLLQRIASQDKDTFDKIVSVSKAVGGFAGAFTPPKGS